MLKCSLVGAPVQAGAGVHGCLMGPDAFRTAGLAETLLDLGHSVTDHGNVAAHHAQTSGHVNPAVRNLNEVAGWAQALQEEAYAVAKCADLPIFLGGDHSLSIGTVAGVARYAAELNQPQFLLWLDAHPDLHRLETTRSGNLHGTPVAYLSGQPGFQEHYPKLPAPVSPDHIFMMGLRSVDQAEHDLIASSAIRVHDMRAMDEDGVKAPLERFLAQVKEANGRLHVSLDVDFLDPAIAPAVGTTVPGGATFREAHLIMELLCDWGLVTSLDLVELNPFLDERGRTAALMVDLCASLLGRKVLDRPTRSFS
ncbi:MAG: arginase [Pseudomonadota bacterium]